MGQQRGDHRCGQARTSLPMPAGAPGPHCVALTSGTRCSVYCAAVARPCSPRCSRRRPVRRGLSPFRRRQITSAYFPRAGEPGHSVGELGLGAVVPWRLFSRARRVRPADRLEVSSGWSTRLLTPSSRCGSRRVTGPTGGADPGLTAGEAGPWGIFACKMRTDISFLGGIGRERQGRGPRGRWCRWSPATLHMMGAGRACAAGDGLLPVGPGSPSAALVCPHSALTTLPGPTSMDPGAERVRTR